VIRIVVVVAVMDTIAAIVVLAPSKIFRKNSFISTEVKLFY
jgi:hypothetical protein